MAEKNYESKKLTKGAEEALDSIGLTFVWLNLQECNLREIIRLVNERYDLERQNMVAKISEKKFICTVITTQILGGGKRSYICVKCCTRKVRNSDSMEVSRNSCYHLFFSPCLRKDLNFYLMLYICTT